MMLRNVIIAGLLLLAAGRAPAAGPAADSQDTVKVQIDNSSVQPWKHFGSVNPRAIFGAAVSGQPLRFTNDFNINPGYIKSWEWDYKNQSYIFKLDGTRRYHDGRPISAYDLEFAIIKGFLTTEPTVKPFIQFHNIPGTETLKPGMPFKSGMVSGIQVIDPTSLRVRLRGQPYRFLFTLGSIFPPLAPIDAFGPDLHTFKALPIGAGPYRVIGEDVRRGMVKLERVVGEKGPKFVELYYKNVGFVNKVDIAYGTGMAKMKNYMDAHPGEYIRSQGKVSDTIEVLEFNYNTKAGQNLTFRRAVAHAINKEAEIPGYSGQVGTDQIVPSQGYGYRPPQAYYDQAKARALFASLPASLRQQTHTIMFHGDPKRNELISYYRFVLDSLRAIGMKVQPSMTDFVAFQNENKHITMGVYGSTVDPDPVNTFASYNPDGKKPYTLKQDAAINAAVSQLETAESLEDKVKHVRTLSDLFIDRMVVLPMHEGFPVVFHKPRIKNIDFIDINGIIDVSMIEVKHESAAKQ